jgi:hypothetical protein
MLPKIDVLDAIRAIDRTDMVLPRAKIFIIDTLEENSLATVTDKASPTPINERIDNELPQIAKSTVDNLPLERPLLAKDRIEYELPRLTVFNTERLLPARAILRSDSDEAIRTQLDNDTLYVPKAPHWLEK